MASFRDTRNAILDSYLDGVIDEDEFMLLTQENTSKNPDFPYNEYGKFDLADLENSECLAEFRFAKNDIPILADVLHIPENFICSQGTKCNGIEALCITLKRFSYPSRYSDLIPRFGRPVPVLSMINNTVVDFIYDMHSHLVNQWNNTILNPVQLQLYAEAIHNKGAALDNCFGFIDGTVRPICRPGRLQRIVYNGHKRVHALKFQSVTLPNGMIANMYGPVEGRRHDAGMLADSELLQDLEQNAFAPDGTPMCLYGDPAYPLRVHLQAPFRNAVLTPQMQDFNRSMSAVRISVEWLFGDISNYFKFIDFKKNLKIGLSSVGKMYLVSAVLRNALTCLYGNSTSKYFNLVPPDLQEYFV